MTKTSPVSTIVVVEDSSIGKLLRVILQRHGYRVMTADVGEGTELLRAADCQVGLLITNMPAAFAQFGDQVPLLYLAAHPDLDRARGFRQSSALSKPFPLQRLLEMVRELFAPGSSPST
jgi:DNA-binding response OmpR family regulator